MGEKRRSSLANIEESISLATFLEKVACAEAHSILCGSHGLQSFDEDFHPGDLVGDIIATLWVQGLHDDLANFVAAFFAEIRDHNPSCTAIKKKLTLGVFLNSLPVAIRQSHGLGYSDIDKIGVYLDKSVPPRYSSDLDAIDRTEG